MRKFFFGWYFFINEAFAIANHEAKTEAFMKYKTSSYMKRSARKTICRKARFIAEGCFIFHAPKGALHFRRSSV